MALLYPWATKEYLLWNMTLGQIIMYHNKGIQLKYGTGDAKTSLKDKSYKEIKKIKEETIKMVEEAERVEKMRDEMQRKYGAI